MPRRNGHEKILERRIESKSARLEADHPLFGIGLASWIRQQLLSYRIPTTIESGPTRCCTRVSRKPASRIHPQQSAPV